MSDFFRHAKEKLVGGTNVADEHLQRLTSKYLQPEQDYMQSKSRNTEALDNLVSVAAGKSTATEQQ
ncbi:hypothetical protein ZYGR_0P03020 [Zygosaccharomyces rouxii]|uniref:Uncharacterized protein n=1 Tax=Zygosaccharomyces rouxii TaxID=4956 RepID=A0A1Q3A1U2_ZYGRO|nr:hypothetical protein ZYGR_0P03020 [Zygosaccharomyces rouxii]